MQKFEKTKRIGKIFLFAISNKKRTVTAFNTYLYNFIQSKNLLKNIIQSMRKAQNLKNNVENVTAFDLNLEAKKVLKPIFSKQAKRNSQSDQNIYKRVIKYGKGFFVDIHAKK